MKHALLFLLSAALLLSAAAEEKIPLEKMLSPSPWVAGKNLSAAQKKALIDSPTVKTAVARADRFLLQDFPFPFPELYLDFRKTGNRTRYQNVYDQYSRALAMLSTAYYATGKRVYLEKLEELIGKVCDFPTWVLPAHDKKLLNFSGKTVEIDLASALTGWRLATILGLFRDDLSPAIASRLQTELRRRILDPFDRIITGKRAPFWWMTRKMNWNAVCLAGITGTALAAEPDAGKRLRMVETALRYSRYFLESFLPDGYCSEGAAYWNYGFGHYLYMSAMIYLATSRRLNLLDQEAARIPALYPDRIVLAGGWIPAFADCNYKTRIAQQYLDLRDLLLKRSQNHAPLGWFPELFLAVELSDPGMPEDSGKKENLEPVSVFPVGGVALMRPGNSRSCRIAAAVKGGNNDELHNHNDVGSYSIVVDGAAPVAGDPGAEVYNAWTFGPKRYENPIMNSFGHPLPRPAGQLQIPGKQTDARLLEQKQDADSFFWKLDLRNAYRIASMTRLERSFLYSRAGSGSFSVTDAVQFTKPERFESALIAFGSFRRLSPNLLELEFSGKKLLASIQTDGEPFTLVPAEIKGVYQGGLKPWRIAIRLNRPVRQARISVTFTAGE